MDATLTPPTVFIGGVACSVVLVLSQTVVQCTAPTVPPSAPGYPVVLVLVVNAAGAASTEFINLIYATTFAVSWASTPTLTALPGSVLSPAPTLQVSSCLAMTCTLAINVSSCATPNPALASRPASMTVPVPVHASGSPNALPTGLLMDGLTTYGASGCIGTLTASCVDAVGQTASTAGQTKPTVVLASWRADWNSTNVPDVVVPVALPQLTAVFSLVGSVGVLTTTSVESLSCQAMLLPAVSMPPPLSKPLDWVSSRDVLSSDSGAVNFINGSAVGIAFDGLTASAARLGQALTLYAECTWTPTGERLRLPPLPLAVANVDLALTPATPLDVEAYESAGIAAAASLSPPGMGTFASADATCAWHFIHGAYIVLAPATSAASWTLDADGTVVGGQPLALTVEGLPDGAISVELVCSLWGSNTVASPPLTVFSCPYTVTLRSGPATRAVWPSGTLAVLPWRPAVDVTVPARYVLMCSVSVAGTTLPPASLAPGVGLGLSDTMVQLVGEAFVSVSLEPAATRANASLPYLGLRAAGGTNAALELTCQDGVGRSAALGVPISVRVAALTASWADATVAAMPAVLVPSQALPALTLRLASTPAVPLPSNVNAASLVSCVAGIFSATTNLPLNVPLAGLLASASPCASVSATTSGANITTGAGNTSIVVTLPPLSTAACALASSPHLTVAAECTWTPTGERVRLPDLATTMMEMTLAWAYVAPSVVVVGYTPLPLHLGVNIDSPAIGGSGATTTAICNVLLVNATVHSARLVADAWSLVVGVSASGVTTILTSVNVTLEAPQAAELHVQASCTVWGRTIVTAPILFVIAAMEARIMSALPSTFIASDASSPWPVEPQLEVVVETRHDFAVVADVSCSLTAATLATDLVVVDATTTLTSLRSVPANPHTGVVTMPRFVVQTAATMRNVTLVVECQHTASGDAVLPPIAFTIPATLLTLVPCTPPVTKAAVGQLPPFSVGVAVTPPGGTRTWPCTAATQPIALPPIVCTIALNASSSTITDTSSVFLQHTTAVAPAVRNVATFDAFTMVVPQGQTYGLSITCAVGGQAISPALAFAVEIDGCRPGQASESVTCVTCGGGTFSLGGKGARCIGCPPVGAVCIAGIITLLPHYFRPPSQAGMPLGPTTELHPCYNAEACTLAYSGANAGSAIYGCAYGYTGPLCGVCDASVNYGRFGEACTECWNAGASWLFLLAVVVIILTVQTRTALRKEADAAIVLRITLGYLQAVGALRVFRAGSTKAYDSVMGWTEVVSVSPLSMGALQCILRLPYLLQYAAAVALPLLATVPIVGVSHAVATGRSLHCRPRCRLDTAALKVAVAAWWASKRHLSMFLFVLFLAYMPIVSVSLRALDCIDPVAGVRYLRSDLSVMCGGGQHAAARSLAYIVLIVLGVGFPATLAWLLGTARNDQLADVGFRATWGFLFDGYRAPTRTLPAAARDDVIKWAAPMNHHSTVASWQPGAGGRRGSRRRSSVLPERLTQEWVATSNSRMWWEAVVLARKAGGVLLAVALNNPYLQCVGATLWFLGALLLQLRFAPYTKRLFNRLETATLFITLLTAVVSTALLQFNVGASSSELHAPNAMAGIEWAATVLLALMNVGTLVALAGYWLYLQCAPARGIIRRAPFVSAMSERVRAVLLANRRDVRAAQPGAIKLTELRTVNPLRAAAGVGVAPAPPVAGAAVIAADGAASGAPPDAITTRRAVFRPEPARGSGDSATAGARAQSSSEVLSVADT